MGDGGKRTPPLLQFTIYSAALNQSRRKTRIQAALTARLEEGHTHNRSSKVLEFTSNRPSGQMTPTRDFPVGVFS